jgi:hypothetical protein
MAVYNTCLAMRPFHPKIACGAPYALFESRTVEKWSIDLGQMQLTV